MMAFYNHLEARTCLLLDLARALNESSNDDQSKCPLPSSGSSPFFFIALGEKAQHCVLNSCMR